MQYEALDTIPILKYCKYSISRFMIKKKSPSNKITTKYTTYHDVMTDHDMTTRGIITVISMDISPRPPWHYLHDLHGISMTSMALSPWNYLHLHGYLSQLHWPIIDMAWPINPWDTLSIFDSMT